jgi:glutamate-1-semialdehyde 2,1-aminomutase
VRKIANKINAVLIFDEITSGFRMNVGGIHMTYKVFPDIAVFGKAMGNGYPMAAIIGRKEVMDAAQKSFISSTCWTERIGPTAAIATIKKLKKYNIPAHLIRIGKLIGEGWKKYAKKHDLKIIVMNIPSLITFKFDYEKDSQAIHTLFNQEMLKRGYLTSKSVYICYAHKEKDLKEYFKNVDEVFGIIKKAIENKNVYKLLKGPVAHIGFKRLT